MESNELEEELLKLTHLMHRFQKLNMSAIITDLSHSEFATLMHMKKLIDKKGEHKEENCGVKISDLTKAMCNSKPATSKMLKNLEEKGYILRMDDRQDKRIVYIFLSEKGVKVLKKAKMEMGRFITGVMQCMGKQEVSQLLVLLKKFYETAEAEMEKF